MNSITVIARIKLDPGELDALDFMAARQRQNRDDFVMGIVRRAILKSVMAEPAQSEPHHDAPGAA